VCSGPELWARHEEDSIPSLVWVLRTEKLWVLLVDSGMYWQLGEKRHVGMLDKVLL